MYGDWTAGMRRIGAWGWLLAFGLVAIAAGLKHVLLH